MNNTAENYNEEIETELPEEPALETEPVITDEPETETAEKAPKQKKPKKGKWGYRIVSLLLLALVVTAVVLPISVFTGTLESKALYNVVLDLIKGGSSKFMDAIPLVAGNESVQLAFGLITYFVLLSLVVAAILSLVNLFMGRSRLAKVSAFFITVGLACYALAIYVVSAFELASAKLDYYLIGGFGIALLLYFILCVIKTKRAWYNLLNAVLTAVFVGATACVLCSNAGEVKLIVAENLLYKLMTLIPAAIAVLALLIVLIRMPVKKGRAFEMVVFIFELIAGGAIVFLAIKKLTDAKLLFAIVAAGVALLQVIITAIVIGASKKKARKAKKAAEAEETPEEIEEVEETVEEPEEELEAVVYDGGPIPVETAEIEEEEVAEPVEETVEEVEEPAPAPAPAPALPAPTVQTAEYDYYNSKAFDPFIATLEGEERNQFTELFILKVKGTFPELPEYVVGGDNKAFFNKFFIYLGQYRDRVPDGLMAKIYSFSTRI
ncbi:MAG: hypothetical protein IJ506_07145 [Clostridia bacterium]|nr:hypothetical protein [Clostridia bacterium]